jgi:hypothetical protein
VVGFLPKAFQESISFSFQNTSPGPDGTTTPSVSNRLIASGQPLASILLVDPSITSEDIATWSTQHLLNIMRASTDQIDLVK